MRYTTVFDKILCRKYFSAAKMIFCFWMCICLTGDAYMPKNIFENWVRPIEHPTEAQTEMPISNENFSDREYREEESEVFLDPSEAYPVLSVGEKQCFEGEDRVLYPIYLRVSENYCGILWKISFEKEKIYAVIPEETAGAFETFYLISENQAAVLLMGNVAAGKEKKLICYISVSCTNDTNAFYEITLFDYIKNDKNISKPY